MRSPRCLLGLEFVALLCVTAIGCGRPATDDVARSGEALQRAFHEAARRHDLPEKVLLGIGWEQTRWFHPEEASLVGGFGLMGLREHDSLEKAARLTGRSIDALEHDPTANIDGAAAVLGAIADRYFDQYPSRDRARLSSWFEPVKLSAGIDDPEMAEVFGIGVFRAIDQGRQRTFDDGTTLQLEPAEAGEVDLSRDLIYASARHYLQPDYAGAIWRPSPNYSSRGGTTIQKIVIHTCQGGYSGCVSWLRNTAAIASAHYVISAGGEVSQLVENKNKAWHARCHNPETIGIEHAGFVSDPQNYTPAMVQASAALVRFLSDTYGIPKDTAHIVGHGDPSLADCNTHTDPGPYWDWNAFMALVGGSAGAGTGTVKGYVFWGDRPADYGTNVRDTTKRLASATVTFNPGGATATTNSSGLYRINLPPGTYTVHAEASGYEDADRPDPVTVTVGAVSWGSTMVLNQAAPPPTDTTPPVVTISSPADQSTVDHEEILIEGSVSDASSIASLTLNGQPLPLLAGAFSTTLALEPGANTLRVEATDSAGNVAEASVQLSYTPRTSGVRGFVFDGTKGEAVRILDAKISLDDGPVRQTDAAGTFEIEIAPGTYALHASAVGYLPRTEQVVVHEGEMTRFDLPLSLLDGPETKAPQPAPRTGCGCDATGARPAGPALLLSFLTLGLGLLGRRRFRRSRRQDARGAS